MLRSAVVLALSLWCWAGLVAADARANPVELVSAINGGIGEGSDPSQTIDAGGTLYLRAYDPTHGFELWKSDGTAQGTVLVKDIYPGSEGSRPSDLLDVNGIV